MKNKEVLGLPCKGGKHELLYVLLPLIKHLALESPKRAFLDVCGGGGKLACNVATEFLYDKVLYNEYERGMAALMACLTDEALVQKVIRIVDRLLEVSLSHDPRDVFNAANDQRNRPELNKIQAAAYTFYCIYASFSNNRQTFNETKEMESFHQKQWRNILLKYPSRIHRMLVTCGSCFDVLERYIDYSDITSFIDPPYYQTDVYEKGWVKDEYDRLTEILLRTKNKVILCGRENDKNVYDCMISQGWFRTSLGDVSKSSNCHDGSLSEEFIWTNFPVPKFVTDMVKEKSIEREENAQKKAITCGEIA